VAPAVAVDGELLVDAGDADRLLAAVFDRILRQRQAPLRGLPNCRCVLVPNEKGTR